MDSPSFPNETINTSFTKSKTNVIDYLLEWAGNHNWRIYLINMLIEKNEGLSPEERELTYNYFLKTLSLYEEELPVLKKIESPKSITEKEIKITKLSEVRGVNRLNEGQIIEFNPKLTVIYGENGSGKTGYSRIFKNIGKSYTPASHILPDIFSEEETSQSAILHYTLDDKPDVYEWNNTDSKNELQSLSIFDNDCVKFVLKDRELFVSPKDFHLFTLLANEIDALERLHIQKKNSYSIKIDDNNFNYQTEAWELKEKINSQQYHQAILLQELNSLSALPKNFEDILQQQENKVKNSSIENIQKLIAKKENEKSEIETILEKVQKTKTILNTEKLSLFVEYSNKINKFQQQLNKGIKGIVENKGIEFYETMEFQNFLHSANEYISILDKNTYPEDGDTCVYCKQSLDENALGLLSSYRKLLGDEIQTQLEEFKKKKQELIDEAKPIDTALILQHQSFGKSEEDVAIQPKLLTEYNKQAAELKAIFKAEKDYEETYKFSFDYQELMDELEAKKTSLDNEIGNNKEKLNNPDETLQDEQKKLNELKDKKLLSEKKEEIEKIISNQKIYNCLQKKDKTFVSRDISRLASQAREKLIKDSFNDTFEEELEHLRRSDLNIQLDFATQKGASKLKQNIKGENLSDILSEGEQKAISLAEFLTEIQLDDNKAPIIFDDPVNSLDHKLIDGFARRIIDFSSQRQIIIFTHSILLYNCFVDKKYKTTCKLYHVKKEYGYAGIISEGEELNAVSSYEGKISKLLNNSPRNPNNKGYRPEADVASEAYALLRSLIERWVEDGVFESIVGRYRNNIMMGALQKVNGQAIDEYKKDINDIFEKCCRFITAHSSPKEVQNSPTLDGAESDFKHWQEIKEKFLTK